MRSRRPVALFLVVIVAAVAAAFLFAKDLNELKGLMDNRTGEAKKAVGIILGFVDPSGESFVASGATAPGGTTAPGPDTVYEIGSITKVFTSLVLADMVVKGEVGLDDPVAKFLPATVKVPSRGGREITLRDLANQVSGLPRMPGNFKPADISDPYADYGPAQLYEFISGYTLTRDIGAKYEYSNLGVGLLGQALALKGGVGYEEMVRRRVLEPLGMKDTAITLTEPLKARLAEGTDEALKPVKNWNLNALAGAGAIRSTARDMLKFLTAAMGTRPTPLRAAFDLMLEKTIPTGTPDLEIGLGWHLWKKYGATVVWHNGGTGGYRTFAGFDPAKKSAVVVLCNTSFGVDDLGLHALVADWPAPRLKAPDTRPEIAVDEKTLEAYVGEYQLTPEIRLTVTRTGAKLYLRRAGQPGYEMVAWSPTEFFLRVADVRITFVKDAAGTVTGLVLYQNGVDQPAPKVK
jgi:serine-type D-Ala-D-Ala carboxypeptidase/endopeptidase